MPRAQATAPLHDVRLTDADFKRLARSVYEFAGIALPDNKMALVQARLARRLRALAMGSFREYCALIEGKGAEAQVERHELISAITTNVTRFFREQHHFDDLSTRVLPPLIAQARHGGRVRIWSAGCSTGEEPYSLALTVLALEPDAARYDIRILATDIDRTVLATASRGAYSERALEAVPGPLRRSHFQTVEDESGGDRICSVGPAARALISFKQLNLTLTWPMKGTFDVIFCRNVVIYFDPPTETAVWAGFAERMPVGGRLFVGHSERVNTLTLPMFTSDGVTTYRRV